jgi:hypothetical protein
MAPMTWAKGDLAKVQYGDDTVEAEVVLASSNGRSLMLAFEGRLGGHLGSMAVLEDDHGEYRSIITHQAVTLTLLPPF